MIEHLQGREKALELFGWTGREAEWIALVCLHSGVFTRAQFRFYFNAWRIQAHRFVQALVRQGFATEDPMPGVNKGALMCSIFSKQIYRALGAENIRHRRASAPEILMQRLLSLDYVLEHPELAWLPTEPEKVHCFEALDLPREVLPRRTYRGKAGKQNRYFVLKFPVAVNSETATFAYVNPGHETNKALRTWEQAHRELWGALRKKGLGVQLVAIAKDHQTVSRAKTVLRGWANGAAKGNSVDPSVAEEIERIRGAISAGDQAALRNYGGLNPSLQRLTELVKLPKVKATNAGAIDGYATWRTRRFTGDGEGL